MFHNNDKCTCHDDDRLENREHNKKIQLKKKTLKDSDFLIMPKKAKKKKAIMKRIKKRLRKKI